MSLEHSPARSVDGASPEAGAVDAPAPDDLNFWHSLIDEKAAGAFLGLTDRTMQAMRQRGDVGRARKGLPEKQADFERDALEWFSETYDREPHVSTVRKRISQYYQ